MKGLFILFGEAFREGNVGNRTCDTPKGFINQKEASLTQNKLIERLKSQGYQIDIAFNTYKTKFTNDLLNYYENIIYYNFEDRKNSDIKEVVNKTVSITLKNIEIKDYEFIFIFRFDLLIKNLLIDNFDPKWSKIILMNPMHYLSKDSKLPHISDPFIFIPKLFFYEKGYWKGILENSKHLLYHQCVGDLVKNGLSINEIKFISNKIYPTNTLQYKNPYFKLASRSEGGDMPNNLKDTLWNHEDLSFNGKTF